MGNLHTAQYKYIPAIAFPEAEQLNLRLNTAPSFHNPKSVIVIGLPAVQNAVPPPLRAADPHHISCLLRPNVVLPVEGAPLVFSTGFAHDLVLHINDGQSRADIPLTPDAFKGGLVLASTSERKSLPLPAVDPATKADADKSQADPSAPKPPASSDAPQAPITGTVTGFWGFDPFTGPTLPLQEVPGMGWKLSSDSVLIAGRDNRLTLSSTGTACIESITFEPSSGHQAEVPWKRTDKPNVVDVTLPLKSVDPGAVHLDVHQYGGVATASVTAQTFSEPAQLNALVLHAGDTTAALIGTSLDQVRQLTLNDLSFAPVGQPASPEGPATSEPSPQALSFALPYGTDASKFRSGDHLIAHVSLRDGRILSLPVIVAPARPSVTLISRNFSQPASSPIHLANPDNLPATQKLTFSLRSAIPFPRNGRVEIASVDESLRTTLTVTAGSLVLQNARTVLGTFDPLKVFGTSAFGPLRLRAIAPDGTPGDWIPLATLVRLPTLEDIHCPADPAAACILTGSDLYLVDSLSTDAAFTNPIDVPEGFVGTTVALPRPPKTGFYLKLRDEPESANAVTLPIQIQRERSAPASASAPAAQPANPPSSTDNPVPLAPAASASPIPQSDNLAH
jgi:hypothetical protein